jgi:hypothetical protein
MITSLEFKALRGLELPRVEGWAPVTVLVGPNGCGKSTLLEAVGISCAGGNARTTFEALASREWLGLSSIELSLGAERAAQITATFDREVLGRATGVDIELTQPSGGGFDLEARQAGIRDPYVVLAVVPTFMDAAGAKWGRTPAGWVIVDEDGSVRLSMGEPSEIGVPFSLQSAFVDRPAGARQRLAGRFSSALRDAMTEIKLSPWYDDLVEYLRVSRPNLNSIESLAVGDRTNRSCSSVTPDASIRLPTPVTASAGRFSSQPSSPRRKAG